MNNAKLWLVVKPTTGIPLFLSAVAVGSFAVHVAVVTNTSWVSDFLKGKDMQSASIEAPVKTASMKVDNATVYATGAAEEMVVVLPDGRMATAVFSTPVASASPDHAPPATE